MAISGPAGGRRNSTVAASSSTMDAVGAKRVVSERIEVRGGGRYLVTTYSDGTDDVKQIGPATANPGTPPVSNTGMPDDGASAFDPVDVPRSAPKQVDSIVFDSGDNKIRRVFFDDGSTTQSIIGPSDAVVQRREQEEAERERQRLLEEKNRREREEREREARRKEEERLYFLEQDRKREEERQRLASTVVSDEIIENNGRRIRQIKYGDGRIEANDIGPIPVTIVSEDIIIDGINKIRQVRYSDGTIKADVIGLSDAEINRRNEERVAQQKQQQQEEERKRLEELNASAGLAEIDEVLNEPPPTTAPAPPIASPTIPDDGALPVTAPSIPDDGATQDLPPVVTTPEPEPPSPLDGSVSPGGGPPAPSFTTTSVATSPDTGTGQTEFVPEDAGAAMAALQGTGQPAVEQEVELPGSQGADTFTPSTPPVVAAPKVSIPDDGATPPPPVPSIPDDGELAVPKREPAASNTANVLPDDGADANVVADNNENKERSYNLYQDYYNNFNTQLAAYPELEIANVASQNEFFDFYDSIGGGNVSSALNLFFAEKDQQRLDAIAADNRRKGEEAIRQAALDAEKKVEPTPIIPDDGAIEVPPVVPANTIPDDGADNVVTPPEPRIPDDGADTVVKVPDPPTPQVNTIPDDGALADEVVTPPVTTEIPKDSGLAEVDQILNEFVPTPVMIDDGATEVVSAPDPIVPRTPIIDDGATDDIIEEAPTVVVGGPGDVEEVEQTEIDTPFLPPLAPPVTGGPGDIVEEPPTTETTNVSTGSGLDDTETPTGVDTDAPGAFQEETEGKTASGSPPPSPDTAEEPPKVSMIDDGDDEATRKADEERKAKEAEEAAEAERLRQEREEEEEAERVRQENIAKSTQYITDAIDRGNAALDAEKDRQNREQEVEEERRAQQAEIERKRFEELKDLVLSQKDPSLVNLAQESPNVRQALSEFFTSAEFVEAMRGTGLADPAAVDPAAELPTGSLLGDLDATVYGGDDPEPREPARTEYTIPDDGATEEGKKEKKDVEEATKIITDDFLNSITNRVAEVLNDLGFDSEDYEADQTAAIESDYEEAKARLARQFGLDPSGMQSGKAVRAFQLLEADRIQKKADLRRDIQDRIDSALDRELDALNATFQFAAQTELDEKKLAQDNKQFQDTLAQELKKIGLTEIQVNAAVRQINADVINSQKRTNAEVAQSWAGVTGKTGTTSGSLSADDLGIELDPDDVLYTFMPTTTDANKRFVVASSFEGAVGRAPTQEELDRLMGGQSVEVESMPTLEARLAAAEITQQNMERFAKYSSIAESNALQRDEFQLAKDQDDRNWNITTGNIASEFGLSETSFAQAQYLIDKYENNLFFDETLTPQEKNALVAEYREEIAQQYFPSLQPNFIQASSLFARTIGDQQKATALKFGLDAESYSRAARQADQAEGRFQDTWASLISGADRKEASANSLKGIDGNDLNPDDSNDAQRIARVTDVYANNFVPVLNYTGNFIEEEFKAQGYGDLQANQNVFTDDEIRRAADSFIAEKPAEYDKFRASLEREYGREIIIDDAVVRDMFVKIVESSRDRLQNSTRDIDKTYGNFDQAIIDHKNSGALNTVLNVFDEIEGVSNTWWKDMGDSQRQAVMAMLGFSVAGGGQEQKSDIWGTLGNIVGITYGAYQGYRTVTGG